MSRIAVFPGSFDPITKGHESIIKRSLPLFDVTDAMSSAKEDFIKFGGHRAAGGFSFHKERESDLRQKLNLYASQFQNRHPDVWESRIHYDCTLPLQLAEIKLMDYLSPLRPFGHGFEEPVFKITSKIADLRFYNDKETGRPKHTAVFLSGEEQQKIMFFNEVHSALKGVKQADFLITTSKQNWQGQPQLTMMGQDFDLQRT